MIASRRGPARHATRWPAVAIAALWLSGYARADLVTRDVNVTLDASAAGSFDLDLDLDGAVDFTFTAAYVPDPFLSVGFDQVEFRFGSANGVVIDAATGDGFPAASLLAAGDLVSSAGTFSGPNDRGDLFFFTTFDPPTGNFAGRTGFVGLRFDRAGGLSFGFAEITVNDLSDPVNPLGLTIGRVGYEDAAGRGALIPRAVPEPSSLALLGLGGAAGAGYGWRRRRARASS